MPTKPTNPFLAGMRATGREGFTDAADKMEYEAGYTAINDLIDSLEALEAMLCSNQPESRERVIAEMADIDKAWSRIKAAIEVEGKS